MLGTIITFVLGYLFGKYDTKIINYAIVLFNKLKDYLNKDTTNEIK